MNGLALRIHPVDHKGNPRFFESEIDELVDPESQFHSVLVCGRQYLQSQRHQRRRDMPGLDVQSSHRIGPLPHNDNVL